MANPKETAGFRLPHVMTRLGVHGNVHGLLEGEVAGKPWVYVFFSDGYVYMVSDSNNLKIRTISAGQ